MAATGHLSPGVLWCASFVFVIPASFVAYQSGLHFANWLPNAARAEVILWEYTAEQTLIRPLLGVGVDSTPRLSAKQKATLTRERPEGLIYPRTMGHHAHDIFLQTWLQLGAVGASARNRGGFCSAAHLLAPVVGPALCGRRICGLCLGWRLCLGYVAILVHVRRCIAATLSARFGGRSREMSSRAFAAAC